MDNYEQELTKTQDKCLSFSDRLVDKGELVILTYS